MGVLKDECCGDATYHFKLAKLPYARSDEFPHIEWECDFPYAIA
jgi:hypothetical protein